MSTLCKPPDSKGIKVIMVVEDDPTSRMMLSRLLEILGYDIRPAENGQQALTELEQGIHPDLILMDIQMPVLNGLQATEAIRTGQVRGADQNIPIIAVTAHALEGDREKILEAGINDYLAKPVEIDDLVRAIDRIAS